MSHPRTVRAFESDSAEYHHAFKTFLAHTDQKDKALDWLAREVDALPRRDRMIDAGAGTGKLTALFVERFNSVVAIEPNPSLVGELTATCPTAQVVPAAILDADPPGDADFVLCSHVFYYVPKKAWAATALTLQGWLAPGGVLAVAVQNPHTDCMKMAAHFHGGARVDLTELIPLTVATGRYDARIDTVPASIVAEDLDTACRVAEFVLNVFPLGPDIPWADLEAYVEANFRQPGGWYGMSCDQDFLRVARTG